MRMAVVADDVTGSNDIGSMFAKAGYETHVYAYPARLPWQGRPDVCIVDTNSRLDSPQMAYDKVFAATRALQQIGCARFFNKTCSVFRGNVGAEFDAMLDALGQDFAVVILGFPKNGRTTLDGIHYVHGQKLEASEFRNDPIHPTTRSNLVDILQSQTRRRVGLVDHTIVAQGASVLRAQIEQRRAHANYLILDVADQAALATIAQAVHGYPVLCGSSAIAEELPAAWGETWGAPARPLPAIDVPRRPGLGILCAAGSLMPQTAAQIRHLRALGTPAFELDATCLFDVRERQAEIMRRVTELVQCLQSGDDAVFHSAHDPAMVKRARAAGAQAGLSMTETARLVAETTAEITAQVMERTGQNRLVVAGGETSAAVCARLGVSGLRIWKEIQPGLPSCVSLASPPLLLVLKSGSFGKPNFLEQALTHLKAQ